MMPPLPSSLPLLLLLLLLGAQGSHDPKSPPSSRNSGWTFDLHSDQNQRQCMEDRTVAVNLIGHAVRPPMDCAILFSFDEGHGGHQVVRHDFVAHHTYVGTSCYLLGRMPLPSRCGCWAMHLTNKNVSCLPVMQRVTEPQLQAVPCARCCSFMTCQSVQVHVAHVSDSRAMLARDGTAKQLERGPN
jgi:hypothetical protein